MITGAVTPDGIFVTADVIIDDHRRGRGIGFLVDTGAGMTIIHPKDIGLLRLPPRVLTEAPLTRISGIGGVAAFRELPAAIEIAGTDAEGNAAVWSYPVDLLIAEPTEYNGEFPSILGRDALYRWQYALGLNAETVLFVPKG